MSLYRRFLGGWIGRISKAADAPSKYFLKQRIVSAKNKRIVSAIDKEIGEICDKTFVGASRYVIDQLDRILNWIDGAAKDFADKKKGFVLPLLVYGQPGVGKEIIATICHLVNRRTIKKIRWLGLGEIKRETRMALLNTNAADLDDRTWDGWAKAVKDMSDRDGTVFLDEFNTLEPPEFANRMALEDRGSTQESIGSFIR